MSEVFQEEKTAATDKNAFLAEIERLFLEGLSAQQIAERLGHESAYHVGRNLREIKKRWARAAARQKSVLSQTQCAAVFREAMQGWQRSQEPKVTTTQQSASDKEAITTTTRREEGPGEKSFLLAAVSALNALRRFAAESPPGSPAPVPGDAEYLSLLQVLSKEQLENLNHEQLQRIRTALNTFRAEVVRAAAGGCEEVAVGLANPI